MAQSRSGSLPTPPATWNQHPNLDNSRILHWSVDIDHAIQSRMRLIHQDQGDQLFWIGEYTKQDDSEDDHRTLTSLVPQGNPPLRISIQVWGEDKSIMSLGKGERRRFPGGWVGRLLDLVEGV
ncbi:hypothetical protein CALCODRAFT_152272 [Calocera cornea HHB12733]|uniref:Uncharacterized protein n=1 Tax=Calocera cornea HHB12733 TaxID=1353952 RepID=A0A165CNP9_9BASI|nr:hypothetical protein CALCODRAFT_152272 [Calocera cornea HHB12733]